MFSTNFGKRFNSVVTTISERIRCVAGLADIISYDSMVLVGGMSRSGTTLLSTVLDSHPQISCGAELLPTHMPSLDKSIEALEWAMNATNGNFSEVGRYLRKKNDRPLGLFFMRCYRAGGTYEEVRQALMELKDRLPNGAKLLGERLLVAQTVMRYRAERERAVSYGFKFTSSALNIARTYLPHCVLLCIIRDPRDVVLSHKLRGFERTVEEICKTWLSYSQKYREYEEQNPAFCRLIRYEDLTRQPRRTLMKAFEILPVKICPDVFEFYRSDSPIHNGFHPNSDRLRINFATDKIGRGRYDLSHEDLNIIESLCKDEIEVFGYDNENLIRRNRIKHSDTVRIGISEKKIKRFQFDRKRKYNQYDYANLLEPYQQDYEIIPMCDYIRQNEIGDRKILMIRHDVDYDLENAIKIAKWESERGIRSTYCLLHTAWYYGELKDNCYRHSDMLIEGVLRLVELGHEINLHNNMVTLALTRGIYPVDLIKKELEFFDLIGVPVTGTSTHGDALCRKLNYRNWELFRECCDERYGGPRRVEHVLNGNVYQCALGEQSMFDLGLEYEAYDIGKDFYHTESGGHLRTREKTKARRLFGRHDQERGAVCGILTHPIWWKFDS